MVIGTFLVDGVTLIDSSCCASIKSGGDSSSLVLIFNQCLDLKQAVQIDEMLLHRLIYLEAPQFQVVDLKSPALQLELKREQLWVGLIGLS